MKKMMRKIAHNKKFNDYCANVLKMYNYGRLSMPM